VSIISSDQPSALKVRFNRPRRAVGRYVQLAVRYLFGEPRHVRDGARPGPGQAYVGRVYAERVHEMKYLDLLFDRRVGHGRGLQTVPQSLVVELDAPLRPGLALAIPIINEIILVHINSLID
jgi:hypothetical protein